MLRIEKIGLIILLCLIVLSVSSSTIFHQSEKFHLLDINNDGVITMSDVQKAFDTSFNQEEADLFFQEYDLNHDGMITLSEYLTKWNSLNNK